MKIGFDNDKYLALQAQHIRARREQFGDKLYIEFGGKLFDDYHASRVLPGFQPDSKIRMLASIRDEVEIVVAICAGDIEKKKIRGDLGIGYDEDVLRLMDVFRGLGFYVGSVVITQYAGQPAADAFIKRLTALGVRSYRHYPIAGYPSDVAHIVSDDGLGKNDYIETTRPIVVVTAPGPGSGKMATCLSQLYHENKRGVRAGYAKYETFPIWNLPLKHPVNLAYEAATADLNDVNMIDPFHLEAYGKTTVNYNRDVEIFPVLNAMFQRIQGTSPYQSPTDMGVNMAGFAIVDDAVCQEASRMEILRRYYAGMVDRVRGKCDDDVERGQTRGGQPQDHGHHTQPSCQHGAYARHSHHAAAPRRRPRGARPGRRLRSGLHASGDPGRTGRGHRQGAQLLAGEGEPGLPARAAGEGSVHVRGPVPAAPHLTGRCHVQARHDPALPRQAGGIGAGRDIL